MRLRRQWPLTHVPRSRVVSCPQITRDTLFFAHPRPGPNQTLGWGNHNMAPALGDAAFLCVDGMFVTEYNDSLVRPASAAIYSHAQAVLRRRPKALHG